MAEKSRRRRLFGRTMIAASALALPLTASISYAAANAQPAPPAPPVPPTAEVEPVAPVQPVAPTAEVDEAGRPLPGWTVRQTGPDGKHTVREFVWSGPQPPRIHLQGEWDSEEFQRSMEQFQREMEQFRAKFAEEHGQEWQRWAEQYGRQWEKWGERYADAQEHRVERQAERQARRAEGQAGAQERRAEALAQAAQARGQALAFAAPEVIVNCDENVPARSSTTADGRPQIVICNKLMNRFASSSLRNARNSIANNPEIDAEVRNEILRDLDEEITRIEREEG